MGSICDIQDICKCFAEDHEMNHCWELDAEEFITFFEGLDYDRICCEELLMVAKKRASFSMVRFIESVKDNDSMMRSLIDLLLTY